MKRFLLALMVTVSLPTWALLPPLYQSVKEYKALLNDPRLEKTFASGEFIQSIERKESGFTVTTNKQILKVDIVYKKQRLPGPAEFQLEFQKP